MFSKLIYFGDGANDTFAMNFTLGVLERGHVKCRVNDEVDGSGLPLYRVITWINDGLVSIAGDPPEEGVQVVFTRTVSKTVMRHDYADGAIIIEDNLDDSNLQLMMAIHELLDGRFEASPGIGDDDYATMEQLITVRDDLQAQIDALSLRMDDLSTEIQEDIANLIQDMINDALDGAGLASGDRLIQHKYDEYTSTGSISTLLPYTTPPVSSEGTEVLSCTITVPTVGNTILCTATAVGAPSGTGVSPALAMFINGEWVRSTNVRSSNNNLTFPQTMSIVYQMDVESTDDIVVTVNAGPTVNGEYILLNSNKVGGQGATLTVQEIGEGTGEGGGGGASDIDDLTDAISDGSTTLFLGTGAGVVASGQGGTGVGINALLYNTTGLNNTALGYGTLRGNVTGHYNTAVGSGALLHATGNGNTAVGYVALSITNTGVYNTAVGSGAFNYITTGDRNVGMGAMVGGDLTTGSRNIFIGYGADGYVGGGCFSSIAIGYAAKAKKDNIWIIGDIGKKQCIQEGTNAAMGVSTLVAGTVTVSNTLVTANSRIFITAQADGGTPGSLRVSSRSVGTNFIITSSEGADTSIVAWEIKEPN